MKAKKYSLDPDALIRSLHTALVTREDFDSSRTRLLNAINRLPEGSLQIFRQPNKVLFYSKRKYLRKNSDLLYSLARKRYCLALLNAIDAFSRRSSNPQCSQKKCDEAFADLEKLIRDFADGHLELERIMLSTQQYKWYRGRHKTKVSSGYENLRIPQGVLVRSNSELQIGNELHLFAIPCIYELQMQINVQKLVEALEDELKRTNQLQGRLFAYQGYSCIWNVPEELSWMNSSGSVWRTYDSRTGCITLHPDYTIMLADGSLLYWEHEGLLLFFGYRTNAFERIYLIKRSGVPDWRIIETEDPQVRNRASLADIIKTRILPYLWF